MARATWAGAIARKLGNALVAPVLPLPAAITKTEVARNRGHFGGAL